MTKRGEGRQSRASWRTSSWPMSWRSSSSPPVSQPAADFASWPAANFMSWPAADFMSWQAADFVSWQAADFMSWPGLARPPTTSHQPDRQIVPLGVPSDDQSNLPGPGPTFQTGFALNSGSHVSMLFGINQAIEFVPAGEHRSNARLVGSDTIGQIARYAKIQRAVRPVGHDVDPACGHGQDGKQGRLRKRLRRPALREFVGDQVVGGRAKPGHDTAIDLSRDLKRPGNAESSHTAKPHP